eukprot:7389037-Prymnesium_polylepis.1
MSFARLLSPIVAARFATCVESSMLAAVLKQRRPSSMHRRARDRFVHVVATTVTINTTPPSERYHRN